MQPKAASPAGRVLVGFGGGTTRLHVSPSHLLRFWHGLHIPTVASRLAALAFLGLMGNLRRLVTTLAPANGSRRGTRVLWVVVTIGRAQRSWCGLGLLPQGPCITLLAALTALVT